MKTLEQDADALAIYLTHLSSHEIQLQIYDYVEVSHALESRYFYHLFGAGGFHLFYCDKLNKKRKKNTPKHPSLNFTWPKVHKCITCLKEPTNKPLVVNATLLAVCLPRGGHTESEMMREAQAEEVRAWPTYAHTVSADGLFHC